MLQAQKNKIIFLFRAERYFKTSQSLVMLTLSQNTKNCSKSCQNLRKSASSDDSILISKHIDVIKKSFQQDSKLCQMEMERINLYKSDRAVKTCSTQLSRQFETGGPSRLANFLGKKESFQILHVQNRQNQRSQASLYISDKHTL